MRFAYLVIFLVAQALFPAPSFAATLTAICGELKGFTIGQKDGRITETTDAVSGARLSYSLDLQTKTGTVVTQHSSTAGGGPVSYSGAVLRVTTNQVVLIVQYERGVELHSLFIDSGLVFVSPHKDFGHLWKDGATGKILYSKCKIGTN